MKFKLATLAFAGLCLAACNNKPSSETTTSSADTVVHTTDSASSAPKADAVDPVKQKHEDSTFLAKASEIGTFEIESGKLAAKNSQSADVKGFATMMIAEHKEMGAEVEKLAKSKSIMLPAGMGDDNKKEYDKLSGLKGPKFDKEYVDANVKGHKEAISLFDKTSTDKDKSAEVQQLAATGLPKLKTHKEHADSLQAKLK